MRILDKDQVKSWKTTIALREGIFLRTKGLRDYIFVVWVLELGRIVRSQDIDFIKE